MGTLATVLAKKKIRTFQDRFKATVTGDIEDVDGVLKITRIRVEYLLKLPDEQREEAEAGFNNYIHLCPGAQSVIGCIDIGDRLHRHRRPTRDGNPAGLNQGGTASWCLSIPDKEKNLGWVNIISTHLRENSF